MFKRTFSLFFTLSLAGTAVEASTAILVSVKDQEMALVRDGAKVAKYKISTSRFGISDKPSSYGTPVGALEVAERVGSGLPAGAVLKGRQPTGEILPVNAAGRDPIVTRILHLRGLEACNKNAHSRSIYIHGTPVERTLGKPDSWGCVRMRSKDVIELFDAAPVGTRVEILDGPLRKMVRVACETTKPPVVPAGLPAPATATLAKTSTPATGKNALAKVAAGPAKAPLESASKSRFNGLVGSLGNDPHKTGAETRQTPWYILKFP